MTKSPLQPTIIVIEDDKELSESFRKTLEGLGYKVICWLTFQEAGLGLEDLFDSPEGHEHIKAIIFDYVLNKNRTTITSMPLIHLASRNKFKGIMLANSSDDLFMMHQMDAGCTHQREKGFAKEEAAGYLHMLLR